MLKPGKVCLEEKIEKQNQTIFENRSNCLFLQMHPFKGVLSLNGKCSLCDLYKCKFSTKIFWKDVNGNGKHISHSSQVFCINLFLRNGSERIMNLLEGGGDVISFCVG
jgi:hypothetical protein